MALPTVQVLLDNGTGTFPFDVTDKVLLADGISFSRGRQDWQGGVTAGEMSLTLNNSDGRFTVGSTTLASPSPIKVDQRIRLAYPLVSNTTFETNVTGYVGSNATLARSTAQAHSGSASMSITATAAANALAVDSGSGVGGIPVAGNTTYPVAVWARAATVSRLIQLRVDWWDAAGTYISTSTGTGVADSTGGWTLVDEEFTSPATAAYARRQVVVASPAAGEVHYVDDFTFHLARFTGYVKSWPVSWPATVPTVANAKITATDAQARAERRVLRSVVEEEILEALPTAYYTLDAPAGAVTAADTSGNQAPALVESGNGTPIVFGTDTVVTTDNLTGATFVRPGLGGNDLHSQAPIAADSSFIVAFTTTTAGASHGIFAISQASSLAGLTLQPAGGIVWNGSSVYPGPYNDGAVHVIGLRNVGAATYDVYSDAALIDTGVTIPTMTTPTLVVGNGSVSLAHFAQFATAPTAAAFVAMSEAMLTGFAGESGTARIARTAGYGNLPVGTLDTSLTNVAFTDITGRSAWEAIQEVSDAEMGAVFFDALGNLTFHNRNRAPAKTAPDLTLPASALTPGVQPVDDDQQILNYIETTAAATGSPQVARDTASEASHGRYASANAYLVQTDQEALDRANWIVANFAEPTTRYGTLTVNLYAMGPAAALATLMDLELNSWLRITSMPSQNTGGATVDVVTEGYAEEVSSNSWTLTLNVVSRDLFDALILDDSVRGVLDAGNRLYV